jgi:hypothetical protein
MVLSGIEDETTKVGVINFVKTSYGTSTVDTNSAGIVATTDLLNTVNWVEGESCKCR